MKSNLVFSVLNVFVSTLFPIIVFPYVARSLGAEGIGLYNYYNIAISYVALFTSFGINIYGVSEIGKHKDNIIKRSQVSVELLSLNLMNALIFFIAIIFFALNSHFKNDFLLILLFSTILLSNALSVEWFFVGIEYQKYILIRSFIGKIISLGFIFCFVKSQDDLLTYVFIVVVGLAIPALFNFYYFLKKVSFRAVKNIKFKVHIKSLFIIFLVETSYRYFGMADVFILGSKEPKITVGYYSLAFSVFSIVSSFIRVSAITLLPRASYFLSYKLMDEFGSLINSTIKFILIIGVPSSICLFIWSDFIVTLLGGGGFINSSTMLKLFAPLLIISSLINMLIFQILYPQNQIKSIVISLLVGILLNLVLNFLLIPIYSANGVIVSSIFSQLAVLLILITINKKYILKTFFTKDMFIYIYAGVVMVLSVLLLNFIIGSTNIVFQWITGAFGYLGTLLVFKEQFFINNMLKWFKR